MTLKQDRLNERMREILSVLVMRDIRDPRLQGITITAVNVDREVSVAQVYVNAMGDEGREEEVMAGLNSAKGFLRRELGQRLRTRRTPDLLFKWDETLEYGERINQLIDSLEIPADAAEDDQTDGPR